MAILSPETPPARLTLESAAAAPPPPLPGLRLWFVAFVLWMAGLTMLAQYLLACGDAGQPAIRWGWLLAFMCFYLSLCNVFVPLPTAWIILLAAADAGLGGPGWLRVFIVAVAGALATTAANLNEYHLLTVVFRYGLGQRIRATRIYRWAVRWFDTAPFRTLLLIGFVPLPIDAVRWLAVLRRYSRARFGLAYFLGRGARYLIFAGFSVLVRLTPWQIVALQVGLILVAVAARLAWRRLRRVENRPPTPGSAADG